MDLSKQFLYRNKVIAVPSISSVHIRVRKEQFLSAEIYLEGMK